jgi:hypothetical protein
MNLIILAFLVEQEQEGLSDRYKSAIVEKDLSSFNSLFLFFKDYILFACRVCCCSWLVQSSSPQRPVGGRGKREMRSCLSLVVSLMRGAVILNQSGCIY